MTKVVFWLMCLFRGRSRHRRYSSLVTRHRRAPDGVVTNYDKLRLRSCAALNYGE